MSSSVFSDFCQAWVARFPGSELPAAWEEDVRANLKKHKTKVAILREELEKEEMYVEYLDKLLVDIETQRKTSQTVQVDPDYDSDHGDSVVASMNDENKRRSNPDMDNKQKFLEDHLQDLQNMEDKRTGLTLDIEAAQLNADDNSAFVTVINVSSPTAGGSGEAHENGDAKNLTYTKKRSSAPPIPEDKTSSLPLQPKSRKVPPKPPPKRRSASKESLNSVSSPTTPTSPLISSSTEDLEPREGLGTINSSISSSNDSAKEPLHLSKSAVTAEEVELRRIKSSEQQKAKRATTIEKIEKGFKQRGQPDGRDVEDVLSSQVLDQEDATVTSAQQPAKANTKIKELMANWEGRPPIGSKPVVAERRKFPREASPSEAPVSSSSRAARKDSDSSSRGRMGSPSGKSHDSSDSETSWSRRGSEHSPGASRRRVSGETRLDRLVRRPSGEKATGLPMPVKKPRAKPRQGTAAEPLYDTVPTEDPELMEDEFYDNHLLYGTNNSSSSGHRVHNNNNKSDTIGSGGNSSTDLGFDEPPVMGMHPPLKSAQSGLSLTGSGTLSSSDTDNLSGSPSLRRNISMEEETNYVNIQFFLQRRQVEAGLMQSDDELDAEDDKPPPLPKSRRPTQELPPTPDVANKASPPPSEEEAERMLMYKCILTSILDSEAVYLEALTVMLQYMKAMKVTLSTTQPVIPKEDFEIIFYRVPELRDLHYTFHDSLKKQVERWNGVDSIGHTFKMLASRTKIYAAYLNNYQHALEALHRCTETYPQFADLTRSIKLRTVKGQRQGQSLSLEELLHKPVARVQKHCLCLQDLIKYTPTDHPDYVTLNEALATVQDFLNEYNTLHAGELFPHQERQQRHLVKNSFIVELAEGQRKLRHLFLFNDVLVCAKYKASSGTGPPSRSNEKFTFQLKWYIPLVHALIVEEPSAEPKENNPANLLALRTQTAALRDQIHRIEKEEELKGRRSSNNSGTNSLGQHANLKATEKQRKKLAEVEAQLVLASPNLVFQVSHKHGKAYTFFLSSEYERSQWVEALQVLQSSLAPNHMTSAQAKNMSMYELQAWITSCRKLLKTNMGSFLMRSPRDEPLLVGDLVFKVHSLQGLTRPSDLFVVVEVDSYGHYFRKAKSQLICNVLEPVWNEEFVIELEGSENLRILVYEQPKTGGTVLRGRAMLELSRSWLNGNMAEQRISMNDVVLTASIKYVTFEETMRRVPTAKPTGLFGAPITAATKREKRAVPFIITSCVREVERRGISEVGIYRVSGSAADVARLKRAYETNPYEAEQLLKEVDIHSVAGTLKLYLRDLPESLVTTAIYQKMFEAYSGIPSHESEARKEAYLRLLSQVPHNPNQACVVFLIEHMVRVAQFEQQNKMSLHNLATVFGPTILHSGAERDAGNKKNKEHQLTTGTVDVMAQAGILHFFLTRRARGEPIQIVERQV